MLFNDCTRIVGLIVGICLCASSAQADYVSQVLSDNPYGYYRLNETSIGTGTAAIDSSGNGRDMTFVNDPAGGQTGAITTDVADTAVLFTSSSQQYAEDAPSAPNLRGLGSVLGGGFTIEAWVKATTGVNQMVLGAVNDGNTTGLAFHVGAQDESLMPGELRLFVRDSGGASSSAAVSSLPAIFDGDYHHIVGTYSGGTNLVLNIYFDGVGQTTGEDLSSMGAFNDFAHPVRAGGFGRAVANRRFLNGPLDELAVYTGVLEPSEILAHYNAGIPEPATLALLGLGGLALLQRRR
jgi:hypothetical protein